MTRTHRLVWTCSFLRSAAMLARPMYVILSARYVERSWSSWQYDYTKGHLTELIDVYVTRGIALNMESTSKYHFYSTSHSIIAEKASLFVCAIGIPPKEVVDKVRYTVTTFPRDVGPSYEFPAVAQGWHPHHEHGRTSQTCQAGHRRRRGPHRRARWRRLVVERNTGRLLPY